MIAVGDPVQPIDIAFVIVAMFSGLLLLYYERSVGNGLARAMGWARDDGRLDVAAQAMGRLFPLVFGLVLPSVFSLALLGVFDLGPGPTPGGLISNTVGALGLVAFLLVLADKARAWGRRS